MSTTLEEEGERSPGGGGEDCGGVISLQVKASLIPGAGQGLFATSPVKKGQVVCEYSGKVLSTIEAMRSADKSYLMRLGPQVYVDAKDCPQVLARYINDCRNPKGHNVYFDKRPHEQRALVVALQDIKAGSELWADYGRWYWASTAGFRLDDQTACQSQAAQS